MSDAHKRLTASGFRVNKKTLYRLASAEPLRRIETPVVGAICREFNLNLGDLIVWELPKPKLHRIDASTQIRLDSLMGKNNDGTISSAEIKELRKLGLHVERLSMENARLLARHGKPVKAKRSQRSAKHF